MKLKKRIALFGSIVIFSGCVIIYRMADHTLPQQENSQTFQSNPFEPRKFGKPLSFKHDQIESSLKVSNANDSLNKTIQLNRECKRPHNNASANIQMSEVYKEIPFDNINGGVWKQGWKLSPDPEMWNNEKKLKVFIVPHSHNDPGWLKTFEDYYTSETRNILGNMLKKLSTDPGKKFIWAEISFFSLWWDELSERDQDKVRRLIANGQLEIVTGGWVMNDEANTHYYSMITQLTEGHQWIKKNVQVQPKNGWTIDPFGESPIMPYLLKKMGLENLVIQRVHYSVKKSFAKKKQLEFRWRQMWDNDGTYDLLTHMTPFYSYDVPHTCGPDPKICCQFDFKRLPGTGVSCPWGEPPKVVRKTNVAVRAQMLLEQYQMKAQLYKTNVILVPLGDDFRYQTSSEWDSQFENYYKIISYINSNKKLNAEVKFGTLRDYFTALREESSVETFPSLVGDFFTYSDRDDHYWSGYYTSRPFYKRMDRILIAYHRAAEIIFALGWGMKTKSTVNWLLAPQTGFAKILREARRNLGLFQHHDGITGTARDNVMEDYAAKMLESINNCKHIIQQVTHYILTPTSGYFVQDPEMSYFDFDEHTKHLNFPPENHVIILGEEESKSVVFFNSLTFTRKELVSVLVFSPYVMVQDSFEKEVPSQISPFFSQDAVMDDSRFEISFVAEAPALGFSTYKIKLRDSNDENSKSSLSKVKIYNSRTPVKHSKGFEDFETFDGGEFFIDNQFTKITIGENGLLKSITDKHTSEFVPVHLDFIKYYARHGKERSGAYLFLPDGDASIIKVESPLIRVIEGPIFSRVQVKLPDVKHTLTMFNNPALQNLGLDIVNVVDILKEHNFELGMRITSHVKSEDVFHTDLNGFQMIERKRLKKLPIQGNFYPMPTASYIEDKKTRITILSAQPLGVSSLKSGQLEVLQDRRLEQDDNRGLGQGVLDNKITPNAFRILLERRLENCDVIPSLLSSNAYLSSQRLLHPLIKMIWRRETPNDLELFHAPVESDLGLDINLISARTFNEEEKPSVGLVFHRSNYDVCFVGSKPQSEGIINLKTFLPNHFKGEVSKMSLSFLNEEGKLKKEESQTLCHMDFLSVMLS